MLLKKLQRAAEKDRRVQESFDSKVLTVDELPESYISQVENPATQKRYRLSQRILSPICGACRMDEINAFTFDRFKQARIQDGVSRRGVNRDLALYKAAFNVAVERRLLAHSPLDGVKLFNESKYKKSPRIVTFSEEERILMCCDERLRTIVITLLDTGMRVGIEALRLKWEHVDFDESTLEVVQSKTPAGLRTIPMTALVKSELLKWRDTTKGMSEYVFFSPQRPTARIGSVKTAWHNALRTAGLPQFPIYQCRHTFTKTRGIRGLRHDRRSTNRAFSSRRAEVLHRTGPGLSARCDAAAGATSGR